MQNKTNSRLARAIFLAKKKKLLDIARKLALPRRKQIKISLSQLNNIKGKSAIVPGKVLSSGKIDKKLEIYASSYSDKAKEKLKAAGCKVESLFEALEKNSKLDGELIS